MPVARRDTLPEIECRQRGTQLGPWVSPQVSVEHSSVAAKSLIAGVILGNDFLWQCKVMLDFAFSPIKVLSCDQPEMASDNHISPVVQQIWNRASKAKRELGTIMCWGCGEWLCIPKLGKAETASCGLPSCPSPILVVSWSTSRSYIEVHLGLRQWHNISSHQRGLWWRFHQD